MNITMNDIDEFDYLLFFVSAACDTGRSIIGGWTFTKKTILSEFGQRLQQLQNNLSFAAADSMPRLDANRFRDLGVIVCDSSKFFTTSNGSSG